MVFVLPIGEAQVRVFCFEQSRAAVGATETDDWKSTQEKAEVPGFGRVAAFSGDKRQARSEELYGADQRKACDKPGRILRQVFASQQRMECCQSA